MTAAGHKVGPEDVEARAERWIKREFRGPHALEALNLFFTLVHGRDRGDFSRLVVELAKAEALAP